jgi:hypothetical protein
MFSLNKNFRFSNHPPFLPNKGSRDGTCINRTIQISIAQDNTADLNMCAQSVRVPIQNLSAVETSGKHFPPFYQVQTPKHLPTPITSDVLATELKGYDPTLYNILISGFKFGFRLGTIGTKANCIAKNHKSVLDNPDGKVGKGNYKRSIFRSFQKTSISRFYMFSFRVSPKIGGWKIPSHTRPIFSKMKLSKLSYTPRQFYSEL